MRDIKILVISDDPKLNSAIANTIEAHCFQWKPGVVVFDPHGDPKTPLMNTDDVTVKQLAGECNVEISTMCVGGKSIHEMQQLLQLLEIRLQQLEDIQPTEKQEHGTDHTGGR